MRAAFFLDNRAMAGLGPLPDPRLGNPGFGGTEYAFLAVVALLQGTELEPLLLLTAPQAIQGISAGSLAVVPDLPAALARAEQLAASFLVFRPGVVDPAHWPALERTHLPLVAWFHNLGCHQQARTETLPGLRRWVLVSGAQLDHFRHSRLARSAVVIPNPVAVPPQARGPRSLEQARSALDLAYVGALTPFKGFHHLAAQWGTIAEACPQARLLVFGGADLYGERAAQGVLTPYEQHCRQLLQASGYGDRVLFQGSRGLDRYGAMASVAVGVVNPSGRDETFCLSAAELGACGIPVVAARRHALIQTVLDGRTGLLVSGDRQLSQACIQLLRDPERSWQLGQAAQAHVAASFGPEQVRQAWIQLGRSISAEEPVVTPPPSTPWHHEQRWLRQVWGGLLGIPGWPSWPGLKAGLKRLVQGRETALGPVGVGWLAGLVALLVWALVVFGKYGGNPSGLARIGDQISLSPRLQGQALVVLAGKRGNDGQQFLSIALDPAQSDPGTTAALDNPIYRGKRLLYPLLAWLLGLGQPGLILWTLGLVNVACIGCAGGLVARWAQMQQRSAQWGLAVLALPGYWITLSLDTADLLATTLLLAVAMSVQQRRLGPVGASLTAALLTRETSLLAWAATGLTALWERRWRWLAPLALVPVPLLAWTAWLRHRFPATADGTLASLHFTWPFAGLLRKAAQLLGLVQLPGVELGGAERLFDGLCFLLWLATLGVLALALGERSTGRWLRLVAGCYLLPALCTSTQILARFPDYTRVWIDLASLALLVLLASRSAGLKPWLVLASLVSLGYWAGYLVLAP
jgi:glycosyltransferase involved in cell wall biosynthesis